ncbi:MAG TPA: hypothetical protein VGM44_15675 [Polyangiaceae bacterium]
MRLIVVVLAVGSILGCGGRVEEPGTEKQPVDGGSATASSGSSGSGSLPAHPLGQCVHGFERASEPTRSCEWITQAGECFDSFDAACACICPSSGHSVCSAAFSPGPNGATTVYCD